MALIQINQKLLHISITLLIYGVRMESVKCPKSCHCVETSVYYSGNATKPDQEESVSLQRIDSRSPAEDAMIGLNEIESDNKTGRRRDPFSPEESTESSLIKNSKEIRIKRTSKSNESTSGGVKEFFTYQITCNEVRDLKALPLTELPNPTTQLIIQRATFPSVYGFYGTLADSSTQLRLLTDLSITNCVIAEENATVIGDASNSTRKFLPFASLQNPEIRIRSNGEPDFISKLLLILNLSNNTLQYLPRDVFRPYPNLQTLDLSENAISELDDEVFAGLNNLLRLDLHGNRIFALNELVFKNLTKLLTLDMSRNAISNIAPSTFQYLTSLNTLILSDNPLSMKQQSMILLGTGKRLQIVDASKTGLKQIPGTLERSVQTLNLNGNYLSSIQCGDLDSYSLLTYLDLGRNKISYVEDDALGRLELLTNLQLNENNLFQIPKSLPNNLEILNLSYNNIQNITNSDFLNLSLLKELSIGYNQVNNIEENSFDNLSELRVLDLSHNPILILPNMYGLVKLTALNLSYFTNIPNRYTGRYEEFPAQAPENIRILNLESSPLLTRTFLQDTKTLQSFGNLEELYLRFSNLTSLRKDIFGFLPRLRLLEVEGNPWHCEREILKLSEWLRSHDVVSGEEDSVNTAHCATPPALHKKPLIALTQGDFAEDGPQIEKLNAGNQLKNQMTLKRIQEIQSKDEIYFKSFPKPIDYAEDGEIEDLSNASSGTEFAPTGPPSVATDESTHEYAINNTADVFAEEEDCCGNSTERDHTSPAALSSVSGTEWTVIRNGSLLHNGTSTSDWLGSNGTETTEWTSLAGEEVTKAEAMHVKDVSSETVNPNSHPRLILVTFVGAVMLATTAVTILHFAKSRKDRSYERQTHDIEVHSISSLGNELW